MNLFGSKDIKDFIEKLLWANKEALQDKTVIDIPAGSGHSAQILKNIGAKVEPYDLFPGFFKADDLTCRYADLSKTLPIADSHADFVLCQEGIEHISDQLFMLKELNRVLKNNGILLLTTPNYSKLRSKQSWFLAESEYAFKMMPPNELDSIWFSEDRQSSDVYFGHIFLIGIQKLRLLAKLAGFRIKKIHHFRINHSSLLLFVFTYPVILLINVFAWIRAINKNKGADKENSVYTEQMKLSTDPRILLDGHLIVEFIKENEPDTVAANLSGKYRDCDIVT